MAFRAAAGQTDFVNRRITFLRLEPRIKAALCALATERNVSMNQAASDVLEEALFPDEKLQRIADALRDEQAAA